MSDHDKTRLTELEKEQLMLQMTSLRWDELCEIIYKSFETRQVWEDVAEYSRIIPVVSKYEPDKPLKLGLAEYSYSDVDTQDPDFFRNFSIVARPNLSIGPPWENNFPDIYKGGQSGFCDVCKIELMSNVKSIICPLCDTKTSAT